MARNKLFQVRDMNAAIYAGVIMIDRREGPAIRAFHDALQNKNTQLGQHPEDFELMLVGEQDDETGTITGIQPEQVASGRVWKESQRTHSDTGHAALDAMKNFREGLQLHENHAVSPNGPQLAANGPRTDSPPSHGW